MPSSGTRAGREARAGRRSPESDDQLAEWVAFLLNEGLSASTIKTRVCAVRAVCKVKHIDLPGSLTSTAMASVRKLSAAPQQAYPLRRQHVQSMREHCLRQYEETGKLIHLRDAVVVSLMRDCALRVSEAAALLRRDVLFDHPDEGDCRLLIEHSKTDQFGEGAILYVGHETSILLGRYMESPLLNQDKDAPLFQAEGSDAPMHVRSIRRIVKRTARAIGITDEKVSGHSLRVGVAIDMAVAQVGNALIRQACRWKTERMVGEYTRGVEAGHSGTAQLDERGLL